jgi:uncharacterized integral membrane protein
MKPKVIIILIVAVLALIVLFQNTQDVILRFLFWSRPVSQVVLILLTLALGFVAGFIAAKLSGRRAAPKGP